MIRLHAAVRSVQGTVVATDAGSWRARAVLVATDPSSAARLLSLPAPTMRALTTVYLRAPDSPADGQGRRAAPRR